MRVYIDSSAYLAIMLGEPSSAELKSAVEGAELCSSSLLILEARRNLVRLAREQRLLPSELQEAVDQLRHDQGNLILQDLTLEVCSEPRMPVLSTPRSLDLVHLQTALWFHQQTPLERFLSLDRNQIQAARELGLPI